MSVSNTVAKLRVDVPMTNPPLELRAEFARQMSNSMNAPPSSDTAVHRHGCPAAQTDSLLREQLFAFATARRWNRCRRRQETVTAIQSTET